MRTPRVLDAAAAAGQLRSGHTVIVEGSSGIGVAVNRLKDLKAKERIVILLTDGRNNSGRLAPDKAAEIAGVSRAAFIDALSAAKVSPFQVTQESIAAELADAD